MKSLKHDLLENYVYGFLTGLGVMGLITFTYIRAQAEFHYIGADHADYGWVTFIIGTTDALPNYDYYSRVAGSALTLTLIAALLVFIGIALGLAKIMGKHQSTSSDDARLKQ